MSTISITTIIRSIRNIMRKDEGVDGDAQRISQMVWMLFMKIFAGINKSCNFATTKNEQRSLKKMIR